MKSNPGPVLVSSSYVYEDVHGGSKPAMKFGSLDSHWTYWDTIKEHEQNEQLQNIHELMPATSERCLYFDIDGKPEYRHLHQEIIAWLRLYLRWVFSADRLGWDESYPEPVVLNSENPLKYSCHVVFPQIQFANHEEQQPYMKLVLTALSKLEVELDGGMKIPILEKVIDKVPYSSFQNFRGPYACKLKDGALRLETQLKPAEYFGNCELSCFASNVDVDRALPLPSVSDLLEANEELKHYYEQHANRVMASGSDGCSMTDLAMYESSFQRGGGGIIDFAGIPPLEVYEEALQWLHRDRAMQWWSWFRICGVTWSMLETHGRCKEARDRIWKAHHAWSSQYSHFTAEENVEMVERCQGKRVSGLPLLRRLVCFDNPEMEVRTSTTSKIFTPHKQNGVIATQPHSRNVEDTVSSSPELEPLQIVEGILSDAPEPDPLSVPSGPCHKKLSREPPQTRTKSTGYPPVIESMEQPAAFL